MEGESSFKLWMRKLWDPDFLEQRYGSAPKNKENAVLLETLRLWGMYHGVYPAYLPLVIPLKDDAVKKYLNKVGIVTCGRMLCRKENSDRLRRLIGEFNSGNDQVKQSLVPDMMYALGYSPFYTPEYHFNGEVVSDNSHPWWFSEHVQGDVESKCIVVYHHGEYVGELMQFSVPGKLTWDPRVRNYVDTVKGRWIEAFARVAPNAFSVAYESSLGT